MKTLLAATAISYGAFAFAAPAQNHAMLTGIKNFAHSLVVQDCRNNASACLDIRERELKTLERDLDASANRLGAQLSNVKTVLQKNKELLAQNKLFLQRGRTLFQSNPGDTPIVWVGRKYETRQDFEAQLQLLFSEKTKLEEVVVESERLVGELVQTRNEILSRRSSVSAALAILPAKHELVKARVTFGKISAELAEIDDIIKVGKRDQERVTRLLRTTGDLIEDQVPAEAVSDEFSSWLSQAG